jgi:AAA family ATP:ADP antiporter
LYDDLDLSIDAENLIGSSNQAVQMQAVQYLFNRSEEKMPILKNYLEHEDYRIRSAALMCVSREWKDNLNFRKEIDFKKLIEEIFQRINNNGGDETQKRFVKINAAMAIGEARNPELYPYLRTLVDDKSLDVKQAAVQNIGQTRAKEFIPVLISHLNEKHIRKYTRESLAEYGEDIIEVLTKPLENTEEEAIKRQSIPKVLALIDSQKSVNLLIHNLNQVDRPLRYEIIKALSKLRSNFPELRFDKQSIEARWLVEAEHFTQVLVLLYRQNDSLTSFLQSTPQNGERVKKAWTLLKGALEEKLDSTLERIFLLLGLKYLPKDMTNAYLGIKSNESRLRANSVEFLENILETKFKKILIPIVETSPKTILSFRTQEIFGKSIPSEHECFELIISGDDNWLKVCTFSLLAELNQKEFYDTIVKLKDDPDPLVKETSLFYLKKIEHR